MAGWGSLTTFRRQIRGKFPAPRASSTGRSASEERKRNQKVDQAVVSCRGQRTKNNGWWQLGQRTRAKPSCRSPHFRKAFTERSTIGRDPRADTPPYLAAKPLVIDSLEGLEMLLQQPPQVGGLRIAGAVHGQGFDTRRDHGRKGTGSGMVSDQTMQAGGTGVAAVADRASRDSAPRQRTFTCPAYVPAISVGHPPARHLAHRQIPRA
jgi:hypothetical protein